MIIRSWNARTTNELVPNYLEQVQEVVVPHLNTFPGYKGAYFARRDRDDDVEVLVVTLWDSEESLRSFAGEEKDEAFMPPEIAATLVSYDHTSDNYEIMIGDI